MAAKFNHAQIQGVKESPNANADFIKAVEAAARLETKPEYLRAAMSFETSGVFSPSIQTKSALPV